MGVCGLLDIFGFLSLLGGLALFLFGMHILDAGLEKTAGGKLERILEKMTSSRFKGVLLGLGVTAVIQSSSATTVMVVGFVNSGIMKLTQAVGVIMGANIGTTVTAWILSLTGIQSENFFVQLLKPANFSPIFAVIGVVLLMAFKKGKKRDVGTIMLGFAVLMFGMTAMSDAVKPLANDPTFTGILTAFSNPILGVLAGAVLTGIIQSSSASVGILQALTTTGSITYATAIPIIMGQNIGTCVTALISCIGAGRNAKRAAMIHLYFNLIGTVLFLSAFYGLNAIFKFAFIDSVMNPADIAIVHSAFNILATIVLFPLSNLLVKLAKATIRDSKKEEDTPILDERFFAAPSFAIEQAKNAAYKMAALAEHNMLASIDMMNHYDAKMTVQINDVENKIDLYEDKLGTYLVQLSSREISETDSRAISELLHIIGDIERIGDHAMNVCEAAQEMHDKNVSFSKEAIADLKVITNALTEIMALTTTAFMHDDVKLAGKVEPLEQVIDDLKDEIKNRHIERLQRGDCTIQMGFILSDLLTNYERVSDHCSNIAVCMIQIAFSAMNTHVYLNEIKNGNQPEFIENFSQYRAKYQLAK